MLNKPAGPGGFPRARRTGRLAAAVLALALVSAACGGSSGGSGDGVASAGGTTPSGKTGTDGKGKSDPQEAALAFARCMREHGVDMPDPQGDGNGMVLIGPSDSPGGDIPQEPPPGFQEADRACRHLLDDLVQDGGGPVDPEAQDKALRFARCMREHGVNMPDPDFSSGGARIEIGGDGMDPTSQTFRDAQKACGSLFGPGADGPGLAPVAGARS